MLTPNGKKKLSLLIVFTLVMCSLLPVGASWAGIGIDNFTYSAGNLTGTVTVTDDVYSSVSAGVYAAVYSNPDSKEFSNLLSWNWSVAALVYQSEFAIPWQQTSVEQTVHAVVYNSAKDTVLSSVYSTNVPPAAQTPTAPTLNPDGGTFTDSVTVGIDNIASGTTAYYTRDGETPSVSSFVYTAPFTLTATTTVKAAVYDSSTGLWSSVVSATFTKESAGTPSNNANLSNLVLSAGTLSPAFAANTTTYTASVGNSVESITVTPTAEDPNATIKVNNTVVASGQASGAISLSVGSNLITVLVTAEDGTTQKTYTVTVTRAAAGGPSSNANLSNLELSEGTLSPDFDADSTSYTASVGNNVNSITVTPTAEDPNATIKVNNTVVASGQASGAISLNVGNNTVTVQVTAEDGTTTKTYTITVKKPPVSGQTISVTPGTPVSIDVPEGVTNVKIEVTTTSVGNTKVATLPLIQVSTNTSSGTITMDIPAGTKVTGPSNWGGTIQLPTVLANNSVSVSGTVNAVVEVGFGDYELTFDKAVRLLLPGMAGKTAGYTRGNNPVTKITRTLSEDTQMAADDEIPASGDGKIDAGSDLAIWTKHFTKFVAYTPSSGGGGGGGGGGTSGTTITASGGTVSRNGAYIVIPAGAVTDNIVVKVEKVTDTSSLPLDADSMLVSDVLEITKDKSGNFAKPVSITITFDKSKVDSDKQTVSIYWFDENASKWVELDNVSVDLAAGKVTGQVNHFTKFAVIAKNKAKEQAEDKDKVVSFKDIAGHWAEGNIEMLVGLGAIKGYSDGTFKPDNNITRAEFATVLVKAFKLETMSGKVFADTSGHWAKDSIATASAHGIISGYSDTSFGPDDLITREQMAVMIVKAAKLTMSTEATNFADSANISSWAKSYVATATQNGIIKGYPDNTFKPMGNATRAEAVTVIVNALK